MPTDAKSLNDLYDADGNEMPQRYLDTAEAIALATQYVAELRALADRMEVAQAQLHNRGEWNDVVWLLRGQAVDKLAAFIGQRVLHAEEYDAVTRRHNAVLDTERE